MMRIERVGMRILRPCRRHSLQPAYGGISEQTKEDHTSCGLFRRVVEQPSAASLGSALSPFYHSSR